ncbi:ShlB/FhaC/HecB family hemolysin secretion/activation protein [Pleurocapsa sp. PCC 7319]|uniref:ShlB/FhaC/HecB family hemolysin secretion/activation protein n=1 Tax=Pleurocapsa sp. PCC 7319 TaxID=118161 RepID=UPI00034D7AC5|nr:ShlB/FhaC/HecB family hemolysin secretion/activation protein [Pleurocapsa sp. PCC 7319]
MIRFPRYWLYSLLVVLTSTTNTGYLRAQTSEITQNSLDSRDRPQIPPQDIIPPSSPPSLPEEPPSLPPPPEELLPSPRIPSEEFLNTEETITVTKFIFTGNTAVTSEELSKKFTTDLTNKPVSLTRLLQIASDIASLYAKRGYSTSGAIISIPKATQQQGTGIVEVIVIEGELAEIRILPGKDSLKLNSNYIRSRLNRAVSKPLNIYELQEALQLLQLDPLIDSISATLSAGSRSEQSILEVKVSEADSFNLQIFGDNNRSPSVGSFRRGGIITEANLLGWGDKVSLGYTNTDGSDAFDVAYTIPINPDNGTLSFTFNNTENEVVESPFDTLDIESESRSYELSLRQPIIQNIDRDTRTFDEVALGATAFWRNSESSLGNNPSPLSPGAEADGDIGIFALRFAQEWTRQNASSVFALRSEFSFGLNVFDATTNEQIAGVERIPDSRFFSWRGQAQWVSLLAPDTLLLLRSGLQLANDALLPSEQFSIGGFDTVRGYRQDRLLTDNGFLASAELRIPIIEGFSEPRIVQIIPFFDYGLGWNNFDVPNPDPQNLASLGIGLLWQEENFNFRFDYGIPLIDTDSSDQTLQEQGLYFSLQWNLF